MRTVKDWLALLAEGYQAESSAELARLLSVSRSSISQQKHDIYSLSVQTAVKVADLLGVYPMLIIASAQFAQACTDDERRFWQAVYERWETIERRCPTASQCAKQQRRVTYQPPNDWKRSR